MSILNNLDVVFDRAKERVNAKVDLAVAFYRLNLFKVVIRDKSGATQTYVYLH